MKSRKVESSEGIDPAAVGGRKTRFRLLEGGGGRGEVVLAAPPDLLAALML